MALTLVTTLPPQASGADALRFAREAWLAGAEALEVRSDLHAPGSIDAGQLAAVVPLLVSERGPPLPASWLSAARFVDRPLGSPGALPNASIVSHHASEPLEPARALELWKQADVPPGASIKHVEPLGTLAIADRLLDTQARLIEAFGRGRVTVLATGELALPFRCLLGEDNALDFLAMHSSEDGWAAATGQRLLADAVRDRGSSGRAARPGSARRGILGSAITHSRSPRIHEPPFDRIDIPPDTNVGALLSALLPHYDGLAVTSPFKKTVAQAIGADLPAVNTLVRQPGKAGAHWTGFNTDLAGARAALRRMGRQDDIPILEILGDGGATSAIRAACAETGQSLTVHRRDTLPATPLSGLALWTWPAHLPPPPRLRFHDCTVGVIAYGEPARRISHAIRQRGGQPLALGPTWFVAQARGQQELWETCQ